MYNPEPRIEEAVGEFLQDQLSLEKLEEEVDYWLHFTGNDCDLCSPDQMCSGHFERFYAGAW